MKRERDSEVICEGVLGVGVNSVGVNSVGVNSVGVLGVGVNSMGVNRVGVYSVGVSVEVVPNPDRPACLGRRGAVRWPKMWCRARAGTT